MRVHIEGSMKRSAMIDIENNACVIRCCFAPNPGEKKRKKTDCTDSGNAGGSSFCQRLVNWCMSCLRRRRKSRLERGD